jgi:hypothetical protein
MSDDPVCDLCGEPADRHPTVRDAHPFTSDAPHPSQLPAVPVADRLADRQEETRDGVNPTGGRAQP